MGRMLIGALLQNSIMIILVVIQQGTLFCDKNRSLPTLKGFDRTFNPQPWFTPDLHDALKISIHREAPGFIFPDSGLLPVFLVKTVYE